MPLSTDDVLIGRLALHYKLVNEQQLQGAQTLHELEGGARSLGEILVAQNLIPERRLEQLQAARLEVLRRKSAGMATGLPSGAFQVPGAAPSPAPSGSFEGFGAEPPPMPALVPSGAAPPAMVAPRAPQAPPEPQFPGVGPETRLDDLLRFAVGRGASDIHIHATAPFEMRRNGELRRVDPNPIDPVDSERLVREMLDPEQARALDEKGQIDLAYDVAGLGRFRVNAYRQARGTDAALRAIPKTPPTLEQLGLPASLARFADWHQGLVLFTGPAGCGKSATLAAMVDLINRSRPDHIISIEDPIEILHPSKKCVVNQRQVGRHTNSFARALRAALREDPDVIAIGELRDLETIALALSAAETGHLVLATLHTNNSIRTINRILGVFPPNQQEQIRTMLSESLRAIVSQRLVRRADGSGRVPALEILVANRAVGNLIRDSKTFQIKSILQTGSSQGMCLLDTSLAELWKAGTITREEALLFAEEPNRFSGGA